METFYTPLSVCNERVEFTENVRVYFYQGQKWGVCIKRVSLKRGSIACAVALSCKLLSWPTRDSDDHWTLDTLVHSSTHDGLIDNDKIWTKKHSLFLIIL